MPGGYVWLLGLSQLCAVMIGSTSFLHTFSDRTPLAWTFDQSLLLKKLDATFDNAFHISSLYIYNRCSTVSKPQTLGPKAATTPPCATCIRVPSNSYFPTMPSTRTYKQDHAISPPPGLVPLPAQNAALAHNFNPPPNLHLRSQTPSPNPHHCRAVARLQLRQIPTSVCLSVWHNPRSIELHSCRVFSQAP